MMIARLYGWEEQESISECTIHQTMRQMGYTSRRRNQVSLLSAKNWNLRPQEAWGSPKPDSCRKNIIWSFSSLHNSIVFEMTTDAARIPSEPTAQGSLARSLLVSFHPVLTEHCAFMKPAAVRSEMTPSVSVI